MFELNRSKKINATEPKFIAMRIFNSFYIVILAIFAVSCLSNKNDIKFTSISVQNEQMVDVFLEINEKKYKIETINGLGSDIIDAKNYSDYDIPSDAKTAIQSYWSGIQKVYYAKFVEGGKIISVEKGNIWRRLNW